MRLKELTIHNFRGFGPAVEPIRLDGDLLLFYGPNGFGKTSVAEAIEWLLYGTTKRRQRGEEYSRTEYANTYANVHGGQPVEVEALVDLGNRTARLSRRIAAGEKSKTFIDGAAAPFSLVELAPVEAVYPVVAQHGLQTFIHSKPKDRRDAISSALGLEELSSLKTALDSARTTFQRTPPAAVVEARKTITPNVEALGQISETRELARRWTRSPPFVSADADLKALLAAANRLSGIPAATPEDALPHLREARAAASRSIFDSAKIALADDLPDLLAEVPGRGRHPWRTPG